MWAIFVLDENIRCFILLRRDRCTEKTLIQGTFPRETGSDDPLKKTAIRKKLHFTDERHDLVTAIRKYGVFADGPALPFRDTGFWARNGVSLHGKTSVSQNRLAIQTFGREKVCRGKKTAQSAKTRSRYRVLGQKWCVAAWESLYFHKTCSRYRLLDGKRCVAARKTAQWAKTCSRHRVFSRKGCIAARENLCFAKPARDTDF